MTRDKDRAERAVSGGSPGPMLRVELLVQVGEHLERQQYRVPQGTTVAELLRRWLADDLVQAVQDAQRGVALHGQRAWMSTILTQDARLEVLEPVRADVRAARRQRAQALRDQGRDRRWRRDRHSG